MPALTYPAHPPDVSIGLSTLNAQGGWTFADTAPASAATTIIIIMYFPRSDTSRDPAAV